MLSDSPKTQAIIRLIFDRAPDAIFSFCEFCLLYAAFALAWFITDNDIVGLIRWILIVAFGFKVHWKLETEFPNLPSKLSAFPLLLGFAISLFGAFTADAVAEAAYDQLSDAKVAEALERQRLREVTDKRWNELGCPTRSSHLPEECRRLLD